MMPPPPSPGAGRRIAVKCAVFLLLQCPRSAGQIPGIGLIWQNWQRNLKLNRLHGKTASVLPIDCPHIGTSSRNSLDEKSKSPLFPGAEGDLGYK